MVSARKYRPLRFDEVVGQEHVTDTLKNALVSDHLAHAFLFCGPRGVGKTSCARILAKALNCENASEDREPCNECRSCKSFNESASFNIIELDAASNNRVEHIRALNEQVRFKPQEGHYKVFIIDEVHMLTTQAFNAFLKTLEEPPPYAVFILATTEKHKILPTILSRCQIYDFHRIGVSDMAKHLLDIAKKENIPAEEEALRLLGAKADGALRDALSLFDRIATVSGNGITYDQVIEQLNILDYDYYFQFVDAFLSESIETVFNLFSEVLNKGFEGDLFLMGLGDHLRQLLVAQSPQTIALIEGSDQLKQRYLDQSKAVDKGFLLTALSLINDCDIHYPRAKNKRLHIEICLSRICYMNRAVEASAEKKNLVQQAKEEAPKAPQVKSQSSPSTTAQEQPSEAQPKPDTVLTSPGEDVKNPLPKRLKRKVDVQSDVPMIASITDLAKEVEKTAAIAADREVPELTTESLRKEWDIYVKTIPTKSLKKIFEMSEFDLDENKNVVIKVTSTIAKDGIIQESDFVQKIRDKYHLPEMSLTVEIDEEKAQRIKEENQRPITFKEKYLAMVDQNPHLEGLMRTFALKEDTE